MAQSDEISSNLLKNGFIFTLVLDLEDVLDEVIAEWVFNELMNVLNDGVCKLEFLCSCSMLKTSLHKAASMNVVCNLNSVLDASVKHKLSVLASEFRPN